MGWYIDTLKEITEHSYWISRQLQAIFKCRIMDSAIGFAVASFAGYIWQVEQHLQAFFTLVRQWYMGETARLFLEDADLQDVSIDGSVIRAHACAAGAANSTADNEALGRSKGGFGSKIHALCDALGMPVKFLLTGGQEAECKQAIPLLENVKTSAVLADKAYDTNELRKWLKEQGIKAVIPPKSNRKETIACDYWHYKERHAVECLFGKLKHYRRISTRYEKKAMNYMGMLSFASVLLWLR